MHHFITQCMHVGLYSSGSCVKIVEPGVNAIKPL
jgi:hypothetical protein